MFYILICFCFFFIFVFYVFFNRIEVLHEWYNFITLFPILISGIINSSNPFRMFKITNFLSGAFFFKFNKLQVKSLSAYECTLNFNSAGDLLFKFFNHSIYNFDFSKVYFIITRKFVHLFN